MKILLIVGIIAFGVIGFLIFLWFISKEQVKAPVAKVNEEEKKDLDFIKQRQAVYQSSKENVEKIAPLKTSNRGALFERAIERKQKEYSDDDEEYQRRLEEKKLKERQEQQGDIQPEVAEFTPVKHSLSSFIKSFSEEESENDIKEGEDSLPETDSIDNTSEKENEKNDDDIETQKEDETDNLSVEKTKEVDTPITTIPTAPATTDDRTLRVEAKEDFNKRKMQVESKEQEKRLAFQKFKSEILLEAENLKKRREEFLLSSNAVS